MQRLPALAALLFLGACAAPKTALAPPPPPPPGMEQLLGQPAETAILLLGKPRLDRREGPARQLQFSGGCVLDVYYYPTASTVPIANHADSRLADGRDFAPGECLQMLINARKVAITPVAPAPAPTKKPTRKRS